ncbi:DUF2976 domain-containing protein [Vibrio sp. THAF190c]|jgi:integrating conjugative element membrane protein (TIGR03745 family)|uniref:DUF2976 domain-containing protein n=1 Tax=Vibrio sp. THAF190c TaxID=2587865 RepID=UPI001267E264|nr:DUF2976 domain-containing protein [Vibrio sp. THAF190c]QFT13405.1 hypothetical protein FIV04_25980 [Vibrio sp. THAF190c]
MYRKLLNKWYYLGALYSVDALSALPTAKTSTGAQQGDYIAMGRETATDGVVLFAQIVGALILVGYVGALGKTYWDVTKEKKEWSDFISVGVSGGIVAVIGMILLTMAEQIFTT